MKKLIICLAAPLFALSATGQAIPKMKSGIDSVSFYLGVDISRSVTTMQENMYGEQLNVELMCKGITVGLGYPEEFSDLAYMDHLREYFTVRLPEKALAETEAYLETIAARPGVQRTESGLLYEIIEQGDMDYRAINDSDAVEVTYTASRPDGTVFDENHYGVVFRLDRVIRGWGEGMKLIGKGGRIILYVHPDLGYGASAVGNLTPNSALVFDVTLIDALPADDTDDYYDIEEYVIEYDDEADWD